MDHPERLFGARARAQEVSDGAHESEEGESRPERHKETLGPAQKNGSTTMQTKKTLCVQGSLLSLFP